MSLYESSVKRPIFTALCFVAVVVFGLFSYSKLPIDQLPDIETNTIMVFTYYNGANASDIENNVTRPLENTLNSCSYIKHVSSKSSENVSVITLEFEFGHNIDEITNDVRDKLGMISNSLPDGAGTPIVFKFDTSMMPIMLLSVQAGESQAALYKILDENVVNPLARIPGVGTVSVSGAPEREIYVYCDPAKLEAYNLTIEVIAAMIGQENRSIPSGNIDVGNESYALRVDGEFRDPRDMSSLVVASIGGRNVYLSDVAEIVDRTQERAQESYNNGVQGAMMVIQKQTGANTVEICRKVNETLPQLQKNLPSDIKIGMIHDGSEDIMQTVNSLAETILYALLFVVLVVYFFTGRWRATMVVAITIPLSLIASFIYLLITDGSLNIISLSCLTIAIGMVVDDTIVVLENITTHIERGANPKQAAIHATNEVAVSVMASTMTIFAVFFPLTMISGMTGVMFKQLGGMMCVIIAISLVVSLTLTPMLCSRMLKLEKKGSRIHTAIYRPIQKMLDGLDRWYSHLIDKAVRHRKVVVAIAVVLFVVSLFSASNLKSEFFPSDEQSRISATIYMPINTNTNRSRAVAQELSDLWMKRYADDLVTCNFRVGAADENNTFAAMQTNGTHVISFTLSLKELKDRTVSSDKVVADMRADLNARPEIERFMVTAGGGMSMGGQSRISKINVEVGDKVKRGQVLVQMDETTLSQQEMQLKNLETEFNRIDQLYKVGGVSQSEWDNMNLQLEVARKSLKTLRENTRLESPIDGVVTARNYDNGDLYGGQAILVVQKIAPVKLTINVSEQYYSKVSKGDEVSIELDAYPGETFTGKVSLIYPTVDAMTHTFPVEILVANTDLKLRPGMFARATLNMGIQNHVVVPDLAIEKRSGSGDRFVYVYNNGKVSYNKVELGQRLGDRYESTRLSDLVEIPEEDFYQVMEKSLRRILKDIDEVDPLENLAIWKPFSFVLVDDEGETVAELMLFDEDNTLLTQGLMQGLDEELDTFLKDLLSD